MNIKKLTPFLYLILILGCANLNIFYSKEKMLYREAMSQALERDWEQRKSDKEIIWHDSYHDPLKMDADSVCSNGNKHSFHNYEIEKIPEMFACQGCSTTHASFCDFEKRYWINVCGGDPAFTCRWAGPFGFDPQQDPVYMKARSILDQHNSKKLRKLNSKNIGDIEFLKNL